MKYLCVHAFAIAILAIILGDSRRVSAEEEECKTMPNPHETAADGIPTIRYYALTGTGSAKAAAPKSKQNKVGGGEMHWGLVLKPGSVAPVLDVRTSNSTHDLDTIYPTADFVQQWVKGRKTCGQSFNPDYIAPGYPARDLRTMHDGGMPAFILSYLTPNKQTCSIVGDVMNIEQKQNGNVVLSLRSFEDPTFIPTRSDHMAPSGRADQRHYHTFLDSETYSKKKCSDMPSGEFDHWVFKAYEIA
mmetsp:Transcript_18028/g.29941  ORF Transcript_18028/g.29941 Transcript_18028/m.29941 type:complete len:245 (-) Transcript_18028:119-853(-)